jgi:hypothetical protein
LSKGAPANEKVGDACKLALNNLEYKFGGVHTPLRGCFADEATKTGWYFLLGDDRKAIADGREEATPELTANKPPIAVTDTVELLPICERQVCRQANNVIKPLTKNDDPDIDYNNLQDLCGISSTAVDDALAQEFETNSQTFFPIAAAIELLGIIATYMYLLYGVYEAPFRDLPSKAHVWVFLGFGLRFFDVMSDWAFLLVTLRSVAFKAAAGSRANAIKTACLVFTILGTIVAPIDMWGSLQRLTSKSSIYTVGWITLLITIVEDVPQLVITWAYIVAMDRFRDTDAGKNVDPYDAISLVSMVASVGNILYNVWALFSTYRREHLKLRSEVLELRSKVGNVGENDWVSMDATL